MSEASADYIDTQPFGYSPAGPMYNKLLTNAK